jgi:hypothetical protein
VALSGGTRRPRDAAERIRRGEGEGRGGARAARARSTKRPAPELIVVTRDHGRYVLVEGHVRMTHVPSSRTTSPELEVLLGVVADRRVVHVLDRRQCRAELGPMPQFKPAPNAPSRRAVQPGYLMRDGMVQMKAVG